MFNRRKPARVIAEIIRCSTPLYPESISRGQLKAIVDRRRGVVMNDMTWAGWLARCVAHGILIHVRRPRVVYNYARLWNEEAYQERTRRVAYSRPSPTHPHPTPLPAGLTTADYIRRARHDLLLR